MYAHLSFGIGIIVPVNMPSRVKHISSMFNVGYLVCLQPDDTHHMMMILTFLLVCKVWTVLISRQETALLGLVCMHQQYKWSFILLALVSTTDEKKSVVSSTTTIEKDDTGCCKRFFPGGYWVEFKQVITLAWPMVNIYITIVLKLHSTDNCKIQYFLNPTQPIELLLKIFSSWTLFEH